jgi:hypothetical protein
MDQWCIEYKGVRVCPPIWWILPPWWLVGPPPEPPPNPWRAWIDDRTLPADFQTDFIILGAIQELSKKLSSTRGKAIQSAIRSSLSDVPKGVTVSLGG